MFHKMLRFILQNLKKIKKKIPGIKNFIEKTKIEIENLEKLLLEKKI